LSKDIDLPGGFTTYVRVDALNIFNWYNYSDYNTNFGQTGVLPANAVTYNPQGNLLGTPRMFKATIGVRF
jgi:hypothetical protein